MIIIKELFKSFWIVKGTILGFVSFCLLIAALFFEQATMILNKWLIISVIAFTAYEFSIWNLLKRLEKSARPKMPKIKSIKPDERIIITEACEDLNLSVLVSIYHEHEDGYEELIGIGEVINVQNNGLVQICIYRELQNPSVWKKLYDSNKDIIKSILIKTSIPQVVLDLESA